MERNRWIMRLACSLAIFVFLFSFLGTLPVQAQAPDPACPDGACPANPAGSDVTGQTSAGFKLYTKVTLHGGYRASGVGMRNLGYGSLQAPDLPPKSTVYKAYLIWSIIGPNSTPASTFAKGKFNGHSITGALVGRDIAPGDVVGYIYTYRADVKAYLNSSGGGSYALTGFASGKTDGSDPWLDFPYTMPLSDGVSLVDIFSNASYPNTTVWLYNGAATLSDYYNSNLYLHLLIPGVNAVAPTGFAYTTFIGADGHPTPDPDTHFLDFLLPSVEWNGADPNGNGINYSHGNYWDTMTVDLHSMLLPPENDFWFSAKKGASFAWVGQVLAYSSGDQDSDRDGLKDGWELNGYKGLHLDWWGADPLRKDVFVQADYMGVPGENFLPPKAQLDDLVNVFKNAPVTNPDGSTGITLHIDTGGADETSGPGSYPEYALWGGGRVDLTTNLGSSPADCKSYNWADFDAIKAGSFEPDRAPIFHYMIFANNLSPCLGTTSGISRNASPDASFIKGATDFIVSLGGWTDHGSPQEREGTFLHMLGHNLGMRHGGNDQVKNKPNYLSVMNPLFQINGLGHAGPYFTFDFSRFLLPSLNENSLNEFKGLGPLPIPDGYYIWRYCAAGDEFVGSVAAATIDWNCNGAIQASVKADLNHDGKFTSLGTQNNWASISFSGGGHIGVIVQPPALGSTVWIDERKP